VLARHLPGPAAVSLAAASRLLVTAVELGVVATLAALGRAAPSRPEAPVTPGD
jgi:hypothetical protein